MDLLNPSTRKSVQQAFRYINKFMILMWRLGLGSFLNIWPMVSGRIMILTHTGRKTGLPRRTPVNYAVVDGQVYCTAGFGATSDWYRNIMAHPGVQVWLPNGWWDGIVEEVADPAARIPLLRQVLIASGWAASADGLDPYRMTDDEIGKATASYRLLCIRRTAPRTGPGGPGDLAWVWPLATMILLSRLLFRRKR